MDVRAIFHECPFDTSSILTNNKPARVYGRRGAFRYEIHKNNSDVPFISKGTLFEKCACQSVVYTILCTIFQKDKQ